MSKVSRDFFGDFVKACQFRDSVTWGFPSAQDRRKVCRFIQKALSLKLQRLREKGRKKDPRGFFLNGRNGWGIRGGCPTNKKAVGWKLELQGAQDSFLLIASLPIVFALRTIFSIHTVGLICLAPVKAIHPFVAPEKLSYLQI